jgi:hypothetical protein
MVNRADHFVDGGGLRKDGFLCYLQRFLGRLAEFNRGFGFGKLLVCLQAGIDVGNVAFRSRLEFS